ncbi:restriction endonuclease subunit S [Avibacterium paragallinarum]|uniref:restriction endonuclease subunit S n=1 Tax=Avibacterium paragallinarum TaxID=728 RepID=UPI00397E61CE
MKNNNIPKLRYPEFTDAWEKCKLGDVAEFINGKAYKQEELLNEGKYKVVRVGNFNTNEHWYYSNLELENNKYMVAGDLLYLWATDFGPKFWAGEKAIFHYHIWKLELNYKIIDKNYLYVWLETDKEKIKQSTNGTTMVHVTKSTMEKRVLSFPTLPEQQKIGALFRRLDRLITLHKRKWDDVILLKKALLQKMFPKNGSNFPALRFPEFTDAWEKCKLGEVKDVRDGTHSSPKFYTDGYALITSKNLTEFGLDLSSVSFISQQDFDEINKRSKVDIGDIIFGMIGTIGNPILLEKEGFAIKNVALIKQKEGEAVDNLFLIQLLKSSIFNNYIAKENTGGTQKFLGLAQVRSFSFFNPTLPEQQKIGTLFRRLDRLITLHKRQHEHYQLLKKALLQQMFV